jgi:hypothetical protein
MVLTWCSGKCEALAVAKLPGAAKVFYFAFSVEVLFSVHALVFSYTGPAFSLGLFGCATCRSAGRLSCAQVLTPIRHML